MIVPLRQLDPYEENEVKGTRMPDYSRVSKERDVYGELAWVPNFNVKRAKNNDYVYTTSREYFDNPQAYHNQFNNQTMTNQEFFRQNAPEKSVAKTSPFEKSYMSRFSGKERSMSEVDERSAMGGSMYATPFTLKKDPGNRFSTDPLVEKSMMLTTHIPFLRSKLDSVIVRAGRDAVKREKGMRGLTEQKVRKIKNLNRRELGWNSYVKPISKYNEKVHASMKIPFEKI